MKKRVKEDNNKVSIKSPEQLEAAIKISTPGVWAVVVLGILVLGVFLLWATIGSIPTKVTAIAWVENGAGVMYIPQENMDGVDTTKEVILDGTKHPMTQLSSTPISAEELKTMLKDEVYYRLNPSESTYEVRFDAKGSEDGAKIASIVTENIKPISFIFKSAE